MKKRLSILGAGIAGLTAAIALERCGIPATVYERSPPGPRSGGTLWLWPNATASLAALGLGDRILGEGTVQTAWEIRTWSQKLLLRFPMAQLAEEYHAPLVFIERRRLIEILTSALDRRSLRYGVTCCGYAEFPGGVRPLLRCTPPEDRGEAAELFDGFVGADGFRSVIRRQLLGVEMTPPIKQIAWVGTAELGSRGTWPSAPGETMTFLGRNLVFHGGTGQSRTAGATKSVSWYATEELSPVERAPEKRRLVDLYARCHPGVASIIEQTDNAIAFPVRDRFPAHRWGRGRVTLLGDAAHPATPDLSQGACQAIEGALALARCARECHEVEVAFRRYEHLRISRTARLTAFSRMMNVLSSTKLPGMDFLRDLSFRLWWPTVLINEYRTILDHVPGRVR